MRRTMIQISQDAIDFVFSNEHLCKRLQDPKKARKICEMRLAGASYVEIGKKVKMSSDACRRLVQKASNWHKTMA